MLVNKLQTAAALVTANSDLPANRKQAGTLTDVVPALATSANYTAGPTANVDNNRIKLNNPRTFINSLTDLDDFKQPTKTNMPKKIPQASLQISTLNTFSALDSETMETSDAARSGNETFTAEKVMLIFVHLTPDYQDILNQLDLISEEKYSYRIVDDCIKITPASTPHHRDIQNILCDHQLKFYDMKPKTDRKVVIRGLPSDSNALELKEELSKLEFEI